MNSLIDKIWSLVLFLTIIIIIVVFSIIDINYSLSLVLKIASAIILFLVITSFYMQYSLKGKIFSSDKKTNKGFKLKTHHYYHFSYSYIVVFMATILSLLFTAYSDVFYQHGDPIKPIIQGLNGNKTTFELDSLFCKKTDNTNLVFVIDVSGSINTTKYKNKDWVVNAKEKIRKYIPFNNQDSIDINLSRIKDDNANGLDLIKLKACNVLIENKVNLKNTKRDYQVSLFCFGRNVIKYPIFALSDDMQFENLIITILKLSPSSVIVLETDIENLIEKINGFMDDMGVRNLFKRPKAVITIFSDFINDAENQDIENINLLISGLSEKSTFFNLIEIAPFSDKNQGDKLKILPLITKYSNKTQINVQTIDENLDLRYANFLSEWFIEFIITNPFFIKDSKTLLHSTIDENVNLKLHDHGNDTWQQFSLNEKILTFEIPEKFNPYLSKVFLNYTGHAPEQFSPSTVEFEFPDSKEKITSQIIFKKGLPTFISWIFISFCILIFFISILYFYYLINQIKNKYYAKQVINDDEQVTFVSRFVLKKNEINWGYLISCKLDNINVEVTLGKKNTVSFAFIQHLWKNKKLKDISVVKETPFGEDQIQIGSTVVFKVKLPPGNSKENVPFTIVKDGISACISKELLKEMGYDDDISDGILKLRKSDNSE